MFVTFVIITTIIIIILIKKNNNDLPSQDTRSTFGNIEMLFSKPPP